jgi:Variant SH3 domain
MTQPPQGTSSSSSPRAVSVVKAYTSAYPNPLILRAGDTLDFDPDDKLNSERHKNQWPEWLWCTTQDGTKGWVPENYVRVEENTCVLLRDYNATELTVSEGEQLLVQFEESGWLWCRTARGLEGWVPKENIK